MNISDVELGMCLKISSIDGEEVPICFCGYTTKNYVHYMNDVTRLGKGNCRVFYVIIDLEGTISSRVTD